MPVVCLCIYVSLAWLFNPAKSKKLGSGLPLSNIAKVSPSLAEFTQEVSYPGAQLLKSPASAYSATAPFGLIEKIVTLFRARNKKYSWADLIRENTYHDDT